MPDWDEDSPRLRANLIRVIASVVEAAERRLTPDIAAARGWHVAVMDGLEVPDPRFVGAFRGEAGLENVQVRVGAQFGVDAKDVSTALENFEATLQRVVADLDERLPVRREPDADELAAIVDLCAWVHSEWVRIHPFANGNGRTARFWANSIALRYGLPPFVRLRPRPDDGYGAACMEAMRGDWKAIVGVFCRLLDDVLGEP